MAKDKPKTKKPYAKVRLVPEDSKMKDHGFYYYAMKPTKGEKKNNKLFEKCNFSEDQSVSSTF